MKYTNTFMNADVALPILLAVLEDAPLFESRGGVTKEMTHVGITLTNPRQRELLVSHRKANVAAQIFETMWVLSGRDDMESLLKYLPRAIDFSDDGQRWRAGYGARLRKWHAPFEERKTGYRTVDQLAYVVDLLKRDPGSRQAVMSIWDPAVDTQPGKDIPCNNWLSFSIRNGVLDLHVAIRSNDVIWGWSGINQFEWSALQEIVAGLVGVKVGALHFSITSFHIYERHWKKAKLIVDSERSSDYSAFKNSPRFGGVFTLESFDDLCRMWFELEEAIRTKSTNTDLAVNEFPEPMLRSWLRVLQWWWSDDRSYLHLLQGTRLEAATQFAVQPKVEKPVVTSSLFMRHVIKLHEEKHAAYGDSWKRRGEMLGIMANIARKIDRLGGAETADETSADTAIDLLVYLAKYRSWLASEKGSSETRYANNVMLELDRTEKWDGGFHAQSLENVLRGKFDELEGVVMTDPTKRAQRVELMLPLAYRLARGRWEATQVAPTAEGAGHAARNERRTWNPESGPRRHVCNHGGPEDSHGCLCRRGQDHLPEQMDRPVERDVVQS